MRSNSLVLSHRGQGPLMTVRILLLAGPGFQQQLLPGTEALAIQEFRISRYQVLVSLRCLAIWRQ